MLTPPWFPWPPGGDCHAIYNDDTGGTDRLAGFLAQINFAEVAHTHAAKDLPDAGVLSFFSTITVFGTPVEITLSELSLEAFYPADEATAAAMQAMFRRAG